MSGQVNSEIRNGESDINIRDVTEINAHHMHSIFRNSVFHFATSRPQEYINTFKLRDTHYDFQKF